MSNELRVLTEEQRARNRATHMIPSPLVTRCERCGMWVGSANVASQVEYDVCPTYLEHVLQILIETRPYVVAADRVQPGDVHTPPLARHVLYKIDYLLRCIPPPADEDAFVIWFEDQDRTAEVFSGHGATRAAWMRWFMLQDQWTCNLFKRIAGPHRKDIKVPPPRDISEQAKFDPMLSYWKDDPPICEEVSRGLRTVNDMRKELGLPEAAPGASIKPAGD